MYSIYLEQNNSLSVLIQPINMYKFHKEKIYILMT